MNKFLEWLFRTPSDEEPEEDTPTGEDKPPRVIHAVMVEGDHLTHDEYELVIVIHKKGDKP